MQPRPGSQASLRAANVRRVLRAVRARGVLSQAEIARATGLSPASVSNIVKDLSALGVVEVTPGIRGGRRAQEVRVRPEQGLVLGLDFGHRHIRAAIADLRYNVLDNQHEPCDVGAAETSALAIAEQMVTRMLAGLGRPVSDIRAAGVGLPAPLPSDGSPLDSWPVLPGWSSIDLQQRLGERLGVPVHADNDANLGARGELIFGSGRNTTNLTYIKASTGLGAGLVMDGKVYRGFSGSAGEIGHLTVDENGLVCSCGNRGCLETLVGGPYLLKLLRHSHPNLKTLEELVALAGQGDGGCRRVLADAARHIGFVAATLCNVVNPERVVVGGDLAAAGDLLLNPLRAAMARYAVKPVAETPVLAAETGPRAEVLGALVLAAEEVYDATDQALPDIGDATPAVPALGRDAHEDAPR